MHFVSSCYVVVIMNKITLVSLQLAEGLLGWTWLLSSMAAVWFFVSRFVSHGTWGRFFASAGVAFISKRLMVLFLNLRRGVYSSTAAAGTNAASAEGSGDHIDSVIQEIQALSPGERQSLVNDLESREGVK